MKLLIIATELLGLWYLTKLLKKSGISTKNIILYYLNPLVILEGAGNLHFEVVMLSFLIMSVYYIFSDKIFQAAVFLACSIGVKLLPLMILPYFFFRMPSKKRNRFFSILTGLLLIIFTPLLFGLASTSFLDSIDLYFRKFEFNASLYYLFRYVGTIVSGYNLIHFIGPMLAIVTLITNVYLASRSKVYNESTFWNYSLIIWTTYLLLATTVHPWYTISLVLFGVCASRIYPFFLVFPCICILRKL
jgi:alpha-1,6-mannosyltransferase